ncbi:progonadoliberin-1 [Protopterus annectens]|uniref:progonadoliberin-1 n=1 Tax=Protopterus annectens TaxID=7888 RepID=UPI001CFB2962|nr:progonadoliberin-1 [Protopterus annectens]XP_043912104.1 progonadoliberin-1 [Protopterus annectens]
MEVAKWRAVSSFITVAFTIQICFSQHWSHGWMPSGKRETTNTVEPYQEAVTNEETINCCPEVEPPYYVPQEEQEPELLVDISARKLQEEWISPSDEENYNE